MADQIALRRIALAVPMDTSLEQIVQIQRAIDYAESLGIQLSVRFVQ